MADTGLDKGRMCHWTCLVPSRLSLDEDVRAKEGGKETTDFACRLYPFHGPLGSSPVACLYLAKNEASEEEAAAGQGKVLFSLS